MVFDYKKEYKEFYLPKNKPEIIDIPKMNFIAVTGKGDPNAEDGEYKRAVGLLYTIAYTLKMSYMGDYKIEGYFKYIVPPLEGFWWMEDIKGIDYTRKDLFNWISVIRLPDFIKESDFNWAIADATNKKKQDFSRVKYLTIEEGKVVQMLHIGPYDDEPQTVQLMDDHAKSLGYQLDFSDHRHHHEIYLSDPRKTTLKNLKTVIRHPIK